MKKKEGFTLIELLAVIAILAVIALISTPIVLNVMESVKEKANLNSVYGFIDAGRLYYSESMINQDKADKITKLNNLWSEISVGGNKPKTGELYVNENGNVALSMILGNACYQKNFTGDITKLKEEDCGLGYLEPDLIAPTISFQVLGTPFNEYDWANHNFFVEITTMDDISGVFSYQWCSTIETTCTPVKQQIGSMGSVLIENESATNKICVIAEDNNGNKSELTCSDTYKLDKTAPTFTGITDLTVSKNDFADLQNGIDSTDFLSGINNSFSYSPVSVDTSCAGKTIVTYRSTDFAGNEERIERNVTVTAQAPSILFETEAGAINQNGWTNKDLSILITPIDQSGHGIKNFKWCATTKVNCDPSGNTSLTTEKALAIITTESMYNRICAVVIDNQNVSSSIICSDYYQIDKTAPFFEQMTDITTDLGENIDLETDVHPHDSLSGIEELYNYAPKIIDSQKTGMTEITYRVQDRAGNVGSYIRNVITIAAKPTVSFLTVGSPFNEFNWAKEDFSIHIDTADYSGHGIKETNWCQTTMNSCDPTEELEANGNIKITTENDQNRICVIASDNAGNKSEINCSPVYKLDKTKPNLNGIGDLTVLRNTNVDLKTSITANDGLSGVNGTFTYTPTSVDTTKSGIIPITYVVTDNAGNSQSYIRKVIVETEAPTITFDLEPGKINSHGWAKEDFLVTFTPVDRSGHGIKEFKWCSTTSPSCDPTGNISQTSSTGAVTISTESASNRICVMVTDNTGKVNTLCSDAYKLDKTVPVAGTFNVSGTVGQNSWYRSDVTLSAGNGSDALSGHSKTTISHTSISGNTTGASVIITTTDLAGNVATRSQIIKIDKDAPTIMFESASITITQGENYDLFTGVKVQEVGDSGHATTKISIDGKDINSTVPLATGTHTLTYTVTDNAGNKKIDTRTLNVTEKMYKIVLDFYLKNESMFQDPYDAQITDQNSGETYTAKDGQIILYKPNGTYQYRINNVYPQGGLDAFTIVVNNNDVTERLLSGYNCFAENTKISTQTGLRNIQDIQIGEWVYTKNMETGATELKQVQHTIQNQISQIYQIYMKDEIVETTYNHPFYVMGKGFIQANNLKAGDLLLTSNGDLVEIDNIKIINYDLPITVYNLTTADNHNYFVGENNYLVHNASCVWN